MSSVNNNYENYSSEYDYYEEIDQIPSPDSEGSFEDSSEEPADAASAKERLKQLEQQIQTLSPEIQKMYLDTLSSLEHQLDKIGKVDDKFERAVLEHTLAKMGEMENQVIKFTMNGDQLAKNEETLKQLEEALKKNKLVPEKEKKAYLKKIEEVRKSLFAGETDLESVGEELKTLQSALNTYETKKTNFEEEKTRSQAIGQQLASNLDRLFGQSNGEGGYSWSDFGSDAYHVLGHVGHLVNWVGEALGPVKWVTGPVGALLGFGTSGPSYGLKHLDKSAQKLDMVLMKNSGLANTNAPGEILRTLYNLDLTPGEQISKIQGAVADLPSASQAYIMSAVIKALGAGDPKKLEFLSQNEPEVLESMKKVIQNGQEDIKSGALAKTGGSGFDVRFNGNYKIHNNDTEWYRNDWNDFGITTGEIMEPMTQAMRLLDAIPKTADSDMEVDAPETASPSVA